MRSRCSSLTTFGDESRTFAELGTAGIGEGLEGEDIVRLDIYTAVRAEALQGVLDLVGWVPPRVSGGCGRWLADITCMCLAI